MCRLVERLFALIPVPAFRAWLLRSHIETCDLCRKRFEPAADLRTVAAPPDWIQAEESLWPEVRNRIRFRPERSGRRWMWTIPAAIAGLLLVIVAGYRVFGPSSLPQDSTRVTIVRAEANGRKATTFLYQTPAASYVWIASPGNKNGETHEE
jgi:predicted anti-sigma-YlaC factor YlaD